MKDFDPDEQPREKAARFGCHVLSVPELLALILRTGTQGIPIVQMTKYLIDDNGGSLHTLMRRSQKEIMMTPGMGPTKAMQVMAIMELAKRYYLEEEEINPKTIKSSSDIHNLMRFDIGNSPQEQIWIITLNRRNSVISRHHLTTGSAVASVFDVKRAMKLAILDEAEGIILCHNHPSGNRLPSVQDDNITRSMKKAAESMDMRMLDHVIVTAGGYYSYSDEGRL